MATIFFFPCGRIISKINFFIWETILLHCFAVVKEMAGGGTIYGILYKLFPKVITTERGLDLYTTCHFHKYGWPNNTSDTSRGATSHSTSSVKGLMMYERWHCWLMQRYIPWWSHPMVYNCRCAMVGRPRCYMTYVEMRFFWLPLSTMNCNREPFTQDRKSVV